MWSKEVAEKLKIAVFPIKEKVALFLFLTLKTLKSNSCVESRCAQKLISKLLAEVNWALIEQLNTDWCASVAAPLTNTSSKETN